MKKRIEIFFAKNFAIFYEKNKIILGTSDAWSTRHLSHWPSKPVYYIVDWRIYSAFEPLYGDLSHREMLSEMKPPLAALCANL